MNVTKHVYIVFFFLIFIFYFTIILTKISGYIKLNELFKCTIRRCTLNVTCHKCMTTDDICIIMKYIFYIVKINLFYFVIYRAVSETPIVIIITN